VESADGLSVVVVKEDTEVRLPVTRHDPVQINLRDQNRLDDHERLELLLGGMDLFDSLGNVLTRNSGLRIMRALVQRDLEAAVDLLGDILPHGFGHDLLESCLDLGRVRIRRRPVWQEA